MKLSKNAKNILCKRYLRRDKNREIIETPAQLFKRVAKAVAEVEFNYGKSKSEVATLRREFYKMMTNLIFLPNSPTLMNAGTDLGQLSACFVLPVGDDINEIFNAVHYTAIIHKCIYVKQPMLVKGGFKYADKIEIGDFVWSRNGWVKVKQIYNTGKKKCYKVTTEWGQEAIVGEDHPILTWLSRIGDERQNYKSKFRKIYKSKNHWRVGVSLLSPQDGSAVELPEGFVFDEFQKNGKRNCYNPVTIPSIATVELMRFLGLWFGDGSKDELRVRFANNDDYLRKLFNNLAKQIFDIEGSEYDNDIEIHSKMLSSFLDHLEFKKEKNYIPLWVMLLPDDLFFAFCDGLFNIDGSVKSDNNVVLLTNKNPDVIKQLKTMVDVRGVYSYIIDEEKASHLYIYRGSILDFAKQLTLKSKKNNKLINIILKNLKKCRLKIEDKTAFLKYSIEEVGELETIDFEVGGHEYLINGIVSHNSGGGTGFSFSRLRPKNDVVNSTGGIASGPTSFMRVFDCGTDVIRQGGKRRGANMGILRVDHPDIMDFITAKEKEGRLSNFNLSVAITDEFIEAVKSDKDFDLINPRSGKVSKTMKARTIWSLLTYMSWNNGEPAVIFIDTMNKYNPTPEIGEFEATNPCGETPLLSYESCNLGSINLSKFFRKRKDDNIDWDKLRRSIRLAVRFLDNVIDINKYPLSEIRDATLANRKIGLGVMGWADLLLKLGIRYDSEGGVKLGEKIMKFIRDEGFKMSLELGMEKVSFPNQDKSIYKGEKPLRNATITTIAPTGTIGIIAGCSHGIEPIFAIVQTRNVKDTLGSNLVEINPSVKTSLQLKGLWNPEMEKALSSSQSKCLMLPKEMRKVLVTAHDIDPKWHVKMQAAFQKYVDNAVSKTVNLSFGHTVRDVEDVYLLAYELGCKGITVYRDGSRKNQLLTKGNGCQTCD